jgi:P27 family predicted phage terminase small subunit
MAKRVKGEPLARPRKPTTLRVLTGGATRSYHSKSEPQPEASTPVPPAWLRGRAREAWDGVVAELTALGVTCRLDAGILAAWASQQGLIAEAHELLNTMEGAGSRLLIKNRRGGPSVNPLIGVIRKAQRDASHYAQLLGLTPSGRAALEVKPAVRDPAERFLAGEK